MRYPVFVPGLAGLLMFSFVSSAVSADPGDSPASIQAQTLTAAGEKVDRTDSLSRSPLHLAALAGDVKLVRRLLDSGADVNARDRNGETPLHSAARRFHADVIQVLIQHGADIDARNNEGATPLIVLANTGGEGGNLDDLLANAAEELLQAGADVNALDDAQISALQYAELRERPALTDLLLEAGGKAGPGSPEGPAPRDSYHTYPQVESELATVAANYPNITRLVNIGQTVQGRDMWALKITDNPDTEEDEPEGCYISTMHGDEVIGVEMCLLFIDELTSNYGSDPRITNIVNNMELWVIPCMNPDGFVAVTRYNANGVDLNRDFPDPYTSPNNTPAGRPFKPANIMNWTFDHSFTLAANFHGGALVVNYPFDTNSSGSSVYTACPDDDLFISISEEYSVHNSPMWNSPSFFHGITNGAAWYAISGGMQDWLYIYEGGNEVTIELSDNKIPPANQISAFWNDNRESMLSFMETALTGVRGVVTDANTGLPLAATITVEGRDHAVYTDPDVGDYHRMLLPGTYDLRIDADGYDPVVFPNVTVPSGDALRLDVALGAPAQVTYPNGGETLHTGQTANVQWTGSPAAQFHVQYTLNADDTATITDGFERSSLGGDYQTGGNANWYIASGTSHAGNKAARGGNINDNQTTWMTRSVQNGGSLSFWYKVSSEESYDFFNFYIDGQSKVSISGQTGWIQYSTTLAPGAHTLRWEYSKDVSISEGSDTAWIDDLQLTDDNTTWTDIVNLTGVGQTSVAWTPDSTSSNAKVRVRAYYGNGIYGEWDESDAAFTIAEGVNCPGDLDGDSDVDQADLGLLLSAYGNGAGGDLDGDGDTDQADLGLLLSNYGTTCG